MAVKECCIKSDLFRELLRQRLESCSDQTLLRVLPWGDKNRIVELTGAEFRAASIELAENYCCAPSKGVVLLLLPHSVELFLLHLGLISLGRLPAVLPWPTSRVDPEKYQRNLLHQLKDLPAAQLITLPKLARSIEPGLRFAVTACPINDYRRFESKFLVDLDATKLEKQRSARNDPGLPEDALFLQFSGGTTGDQKCVVVTASMLAHQLECLGKVLRLSSEDGIISWLPLYHDMGLIGCFWLPLWHAACSTQFAAEDWLIDPGMLFNLMDRYRGTFCWLPNFAFAYLAGQKNRINQAVNLSHVRAWINCSEPVRESSFDSFIRAFAALGVRADQCQASYAMAENVFAVTQTPLNTLPVTFDRRSLLDSSIDERRTSHILASQCYVSSGRVLPDADVRIMQSGGCVCGDSVPGTIEIRTKSLFSGYWGKDGFRAQSLTSDGWYATGDYGFTHQNSLYVIGRVKDVIIAAGANVFPEDIEGLVNTVNGIYPGRVVAFGIDDELQGTESIAVVAEMKGKFDDSSAVLLEREIRQLISSVLGIVPRYVRVMPERWIVKSTAGKISRRETRAKFEPKLPGSTSEAWKHR